MESHEINIREARQLRLASGGGTADRQEMGYEWFLWVLMIVMIRWRSESKKML
jgi:hypothetical protein